MDRSSHYKCCCSQISLHTSWRDKNGHCNPRKESTTWKKQSSALLSTLLCTFHTVYGAFHDPVAGFLYVGYLHSMQMAILTGIEQIS